MQLSDARTGTHLFEFVTIGYVGLDSKLNDSNMIIEPKFFLLDALVYWVI